MNKGAVVFCLISIVCQAYQPAIEVNKEYIKEMRDKGFNAFIANKKRQYQLMTQVTNIPIVGSLVTWGLETIGNVNTQEAKLFLERVFHDEPAFLTVTQSFENHPENVTYLHDVFKQISDETLQKRSKEELVTAMRSTRHEEVPIPRKMSEKNDQGEYTIPDSKFFNFAACSLFALHMFEQEATNKKNQQRRRKKQINSTYRKDTYGNKIAFTTPLADRHTNWGYGNVRARFSYS